MKNLFRLLFLINTVKYLNPLKKKKETLYLIFKTWLNIVLGEAYACAKGIRKVLGLPPIKKYGVINLENEPAYIDRACLELLEFLAELRSKHIKAQKDLHISRYRWNHLISLKTKEALRSIPLNVKYIPNLEFENSNLGNVKLSKDSVDITYKNLVPKRDSPKEIKLVNKINTDLHEEAKQKASIAQGQFKRGEIKTLLKAKNDDELKEPVTKNIIGYASPFLAYFTKLCLILNYISEGIILQNIFHHNLGYSETESWIVASSLVGVTFGISRLIFNHSERLLRSIKKQWWIITMFSILFFFQLTASGVLSNYNIQQERKIENLRTDRIDLAIKQGALDGLDEDDDSIEIVDLEQKIDALKNDIKRRSDELKITPIWATTVGYLIVALVSVLTLFFTIVLKVIGEVYSYASNLRKTIKESSQTIVDIEELYLEKTKALLLVYDQRHLLSYYLAKKHILELILAQKENLNTEEFYKSYNIKK